MVDPESVERRLREIDRRIVAARGVRDRGRELFLADEDLQTLAEHHLQIAIQSAIDIAVHILAEDFPHTPEDYASAFRSLGRLGIIEPSLADQLASAAGLRNVIVHLYLDLDIERVWSSLEELDLIERYAEGIRAYLAR